MQVTDWWFNYKLYRWTQVDSRFVQHSTAKRKGHFFKDFAGTNSILRGLNELLNLDSMSSEASSISNHRVTVFARTRFFQNPQ